jgi:O-antigen ligase
VCAFAFSAQQTMLAEAKLVSAYRLALYLNEEPAQPGDAGWQQVTAPIRQEVRRLALEGASIDPHNRRVAPLLGEEMAKYGDWDGALALWSGVLQSHPFVPVILTNAARASVALGRREEAQGYLQRAMSVAPRAPAVLALAVAMLADAGARSTAFAIARTAMDTGRANLDLLSNAIVLSELQGDAALRDRAASLLRAQNPPAVADAYMQLASHYLSQRDSASARAAWRVALTADPSQATRQAALELLATGHDTVPTSHP